MSAPLRRLVAVLVVLLLVAGVALLTLRGMGLDVAMGPFASASPTSTASPTPLPAASREPQAVFSEIEEQVRAQRLLPTPDIGPAEVIGRDELAAELRAIFDADYPPARREADNIALRALGLLGEGQDFAELQLELLTDQVIGFYDQDRRRMVVVTDAGVDAQARMTYAHEYTHALQDGAFGIDALGTDTLGEDDRNLAHLSLIEGDASLVMVLWAIEHDPAGLGEVASGPVPDMGSIPDWMVAQLSFPYTAGANFVASLYQSGGFDAVDAAYADPPDSTEQILHQDKYVSGEAPVAVAETDVAAALGDGWTNVPSTTLGEGLIAIWLRHLGADQTDADNAARGWGGDRASAASNADGEVALVLRLAFDSRTQADEFEAAYADLVETLPLPGRVTRTGDLELSVVQATDASRLDALTAAAE
ncbi:MAG: hypothetical protein ABI622_09005 [Chloroflexota bacterium]